MFVAINTVTVREVTHSVFYLRIGRCEMGYNLGTHREYFMDEKLSLGEDKFYICPKLNIAHKYYIAEIELAFGHMHVYGYQI